MGNQSPMRAGFRKTAVSIRNVLQTNSVGTRPANSSPVDAVSQQKDVLHKRLSMNPLHAGFCFVPRFSSIQRSRIAYQFGIQLGGAVAVHDVKKVDVEFVWGPGLNGRSD